MIFCFLGTATAGSIHPQIFILMLWQAEYVFDHSSILLVFPDYENIEMKITATSGGGVSHFIQIPN